MGNRRDPTNHPVQFKFHHWRSFPYGLTTDDTITTPARALLLNNRKAPGHVDKFLSGPSRVSPETRLVKPQIQRLTNLISFVVFLSHVKWHQRSGGQKTTSTPLTRATRWVSVAVQFFSSLLCCVLFLLRLGLCLWCWTNLGLTKLSSDMFPSSKAVVAGDWTGTGQGQVTINGGKQGGHSVSV